MVPGGLLRRPSWTVSMGCGERRGPRTLARTTTTKRTSAVMAVRIRQTLASTRPAGAPSEPPDTASAACTLATPLTTPPPAPSLHEGRGVEVAEAHGHGRLRHLRVDGGTEEGRAHAPRLGQQQLGAVQRLLERALRPEVGGDHLLALEVHGARVRGPVLEDGE